LIHDIRYAFRILVKSPNFTLVAVLTLALGIAANSTIFTWISSTLLNPIPGVSHTSDLVTINRGEQSDHPSPPFSYPDLRDLQERTRSFSGMLGYHDDYMSLTGAGKPERIYGALTTANYFDVLRLRPILGRGFLLEEERLRTGAAVVMISYSIWQNHFAQDPLVIGKTIQINRHPYTIIGVTPREFQGCKTGLRTDVWIPLTMDQLVWGPNRPDERSTFWLNVLGRLRPGISAVQAQAELNPLMQEIAERFPEDHRDSPNQVALEPLWRSPFGINVYLYKTLPLLLGLAAVLLLLACANVANLLLVRSVARRREIAIRLALGASRGQLVRQLLIESLILSLAAGIVAISMTLWTARSLDAFFPPSVLPLSNNQHVDYRVLLATTVISILAALIFGVLPAIRSLNLPVQTVLKEEASSASVAFRKTRLSSSLVVAQIALSLLLLVCAGLFTRTLQKAQNSDPGFDPEHVLLAGYELSPAGYSHDSAVAFDRQLLAKLRTMPSVESVTLADFSPLSFSIHSRYFQLEGYVPQVHESMEISDALAGPNYFHTLRTTLVSGRDFTDQDGAQSQPVAIVNQVLADRYWPGQDIIGKRIYDGEQTFTVVGVARNAKYRLLTYAPEPVVYLPFFQTWGPTQETTVHVRVLGDPKAFGRSVEQAVHELNPELPVFNVNPLKVTMRFGTILESVAAAFAGAFGVLAMLLAAVGIYGVVAYTTRQRTREIGIRMALGAQKSQIYQLVLRQGFLLTIAGLAIGVALSVVLSRFLRSRLYGVSDTDALTYISVALLLSAVSLLACHIPARRATKIEPNIALRYE
jgi:predicted permease